MRTLSRAFWRALLGLPVRSDGSSHVVTYGHSYFVCKCGQALITDKKVQLDHGQLSGCVSAHSSCFFLPAYSWHILPGEVALKSAHANALESICTDVLERIIADASENAYAGLLRSFHLGAFESVRTDALRTDWLASTLRPSLTGCLCGRFRSFLVVALRTACTNDSGVGPTSRVQTLLKCPNSLEHVSTSAREINFPAYSA